MQNDEKRILLERIRKDCSEYRKNCKGCPWADSSDSKQLDFECLFFDPPEWWNIEEILSRLEGVDNHE